MRKTLCCSILLGLAACATAREPLTLFQDPESGLYGYEGSNGVIVIAPQYPKAKPFSESGLAEVYTDEGDWTLIDRFGTVVEGKSEFD